MGRKTKTLASLLVLIFLISLVLFSPATVKASSKTLVVPDQYPTIQQAINNARTGDTVFVKDGIYDQPIAIDKPLSLVGEDNQKTIIAEEEAVTVLNHVTITIGASNVFLSGFAIKDSNRAIGLYGNPNGVKIAGNRIVNNSIGIQLDSTNINWIISGNVFENNSFEGIVCDDSTINLTITQNSFSGNYAAIEANGGKITISNNQILNNSYGISLYDTSNVDIFENSITNNNRYDALESEFGETYGFGISFGWSCNNTSIHDNLVGKNPYGFYLANVQLTDKMGNNYQGSNNLIFRNNIIGNSKNAYVSTIFPNNVTGLSNFVNGTAQVLWDNGNTGNYWSDYNGVGSYVINNNNIDHHPLTQPVSISSTPTVEPNFSPLLMVTAIAIVLLVVATVSLLVYRRHRKNS